MQFGGGAGAPPSLPAAATCLQAPGITRPSADVVGYFKFDNFPGDNGAFTDDAGKGLRGLLGFPFSAPLSVPGPSGQAGDLAVSLDGSGGLAADDSPAQLLNFLTPPLTLECWVRSTNDLQIGRQGVAIHHERVVTGCGKRAWNAAED